MIVMLVVIGVAVWFMWDRVAQVQRDMDALKRKLGVIEPPSPGAP